MVVMNPNHLSFGLILMWGSQENIGMFIWDNMINFLSFPLCGHGFLSWETYLSLCGIFQVFRGYPFQDYIYPKVLKNIINDYPSYDKHWVTIMIFITPHIMNCCSIWNHEVKKNAIDILKSYLYNMVLSAIYVRFLISKM